MKNELIKRVISSIILIPISFFIIIKGSIMFNFFLFIIFLLSLSEWIKMKNNTIVKVLGFLFLVLSFFSIYNLRNDVDEGFLNVIFVLIICISTDMGGFIFGKLFKGPKLTSISPNKTYSGILGSFLLTIIISTIFINVFKENFLNNNLILTYFFIILISSISQLGDLLISYFKRRSKLKDTGNIIPGHGGILDRVDGILVGIPLGFISMIIF